MVLHILEWLPKCETKEDLEDIEMFYIMNDPNTTMNLVKHAPKKTTYVANEDYEEYELRGEAYDTRKSAMRRNKWMSIALL